MAADTFSFMEYKNRDLIKLFQELAEMAKTGDVKSALAVIDLGEDRHKWVIAGDYRQSPGRLFRPCNKLFFIVQELDKEATGC